MLQALAPVELFLAGPPRAEWSDYEILADALPGCGPLGGLVAGLRRMQTTRLLVLAVDLPAMRADYLQALLARGEGVVPQRTDLFEPLCAVYPASSRPLAEKLLATGQLSLQHFVRECLLEGLVRAQPITEEEAPLFTNLNTPADLP